MYCKCKIPQLKKISISGNVIDVCSKSLGGCGGEYDNNTKVSDIVNNTLFERDKSIIWTGVTGTFRIPFDGFYYVTTTINEFTYSYVTQRKAGETVECGQNTYIHKIQ